MTTQDESEVTPPTSVARALELYLANDEDAALDMLLDCWRDNRASEIAAVIRELSKHIAKPPLDEKTREKRLRQWLETAEAMSERDVDHLLAELPRFLRRQAEVCLEEIESWLPDPRVSEALISLIRDPPSGYTDAKSVTFWEELIKILKAHSAPSSSAHIYALSLDHTESYSKASTFLAHWLPLTAQSIAQAFDDPVLRPHDRSCCQRFLELFRNPLAARNDEMLSAVYANPENNDLRSVLADALQEAGDPRGEFLMLQVLDAEVGLSSEQEKRAHQLRYENERAWLGPLDHALISSVEYRRGFPVMGRVRKPELGALERPDWATFEDLDLSRLTDEEQSTLLANPALRHLRVLRTDKIVGSTLISVEELWVHKHRSGDQQVSGWAQCESFPSLRLVRFEWAVRPQPLRAWWWQPGTMGCGLRNLVLCWDFTETFESLLDADERKAEYLRAWNEEIQQPEFPLKRLTITVDSYDLVFTRPRQGERWRLEVRVRYTDPAEVANLLCCVPLGFLVSIRFDCEEISDERVKAARSSIENLKRHLQSFPSIESVSLPT